MIVARIPPLSLAKVMGAVYAAIGFVIGAIAAITSFFGATIGTLSHGNAEPWLGALIGIGALVAARAIGGVELEVLER